MRFWRLFSKIYYIEISMGFLTFPEKISQFHVFSLVSLNVNTCQIGNISAASCLRRHLFVFSRLSPQKDYRFRYNQDVISTSSKMVFILPDKWVKCKYRQISFKDYSLGIHFCKRLQEWTDWPSQQWTD